MITLLVAPRRFDAGDGAPMAAAGRDAAAAGCRKAAELIVEGDAYRHLFRARRLAAGDRLRVVDGGGRARWGEVIRVGGSAAAVMLGTPAADNEPGLRLELLVSTLRPERASWLVEKATELGAFAVRFLNAERAPRSFGEGTIARLRRVAAAAVEQCHRSRCPEVTGPHPFAEIVGSGPLVDLASRRWLLDPAAPARGFARPPEAFPAPAASGLRSASPADPPALAQSPLAARSAASDSASAAVELLLVGPEGGWSAAEIEALEAGGWQRVALGPRVLRIETAALAGAALLLLPAPA